MLSPGEASDLLPPRTHELSPPTPSTPGFGGRIVVGTLVALGIHLALREWVYAAAGAIGVSEIGGELWLALGLRVIGAVVGGVIAGAGRAKSFSTGAVVGAASGAAWLAVDSYPDVTFDLVRLLAAGGLLSAGGIAAVVGGMVWPPPVEVKPPESSHNSSLFKLKADDGKRRQGRPVAWLRVVVAATIALIGVTGADLIREGLSKLPKGTFNNLTMTARSDAIIAGFIAIVAGVVAGATTGRGWRQGALAGLVTMLATVILGASLPDGPPLAVQYVMQASGLESPGAALAAAGVGVFCLITVSGWFGSQLFPVLRKRQRLGD